MNIFMTGGTGLIGQSLTHHLLSKGHTLTLLSRNPKQARCYFNGSNIHFVATLNGYTHFNDFDAVINLAGEPIFNKAWTNKQKKCLLDSRLSITERLVELINMSQHPPHSFISGSAIGYYGDNGECAVNEEHLKGKQFPAQLCEQWEQAALQASCRTCISRTANVLSSHGGMLANMLPLYRYGLAGKLGTGTQYWAWIHIQDMVAGLDFLLNHPTCQGIFNLCSPNPTPNRIFSRTLANAIHRPHFAFVPSFILKLILGERAQLLLDSQNILPCRLKKAGFQFRFADLTSALHDCLKKGN